MQQLVAEAQMASKQLEARLAHPWKPSKHAASGRGAETQASSLYARRLAVGWAHFAASSSLPVGGDLQGARVSSGLQEVVDARLFPLQAVGRVRFPVSKLRR